MEHTEIKNYTSIKYQKNLFLRLIKKHPDQKDILKALRIAQQAHQGQYRASSHEPYVIHPIRMANFILNDLRENNPDLIIAALLHDAVEDSTMTLKDIKKEFNQEITRLVKNQTRPRPKNETETQKKKSKTIKFTKLMKADQDTRLVKCVDLLDNMRSWPMFKKNDPIRQKFPRWFQETKEFYLPMAAQTNKKILAAMKVAFKKAQR